jgi:group I intron endonuclease
MIIYLITNKVNGKKYVGQHCGESESRWKQHLAAALKIENPLPLYRAMRKYGSDKFVYKVLETIPLEKGQAYLDEREKYWIKKNNSLVTENGYNLTEGGQGIVSYFCQVEKGKQLSNRLDKMDYGQYDPFTGELIRVWDKAKDAEVALNVRSTHMVNSSNWHFGKGKYAKTTGGYMWLVLPNGTEFPSKITPLESKSKSYGKDISLNPTQRDQKSGETEEIGQYFLSGFLVEVWPNNTNFISNSTGIAKTSLKRALDGDSRMAGGYQWKRFPTGTSPDKINIEIKPSKVELSVRQVKSIPVVQFLEGKRIFTYGSILEAIVDTDTKITELLRSLESQKEDSNGFTWRWHYDT